MLQLAALKPEPGDWFEACCTWCPTPFTTPIWEWEEDPMHENGWKGRRFGCKNRQSSLPFAPDPAPTPISTPGDPVTERTTMEDALHRVLHASFDALLSDDPWTGISDAIAAEFTGGAVLLSLEPGWSPMGKTFFAGIDSAAIRSVCDYYHRTNPWAPYQFTWPEGYFGHGYDQCGPAQLVHEEFYTDWMKPSGIGSMVSYGGFAYRRSGVDQLTIAILHDPAIREFSSDLFRLGKELMPFLRRTFLLLEKFASPFVAPVRDIEMSSESVVRWSVGTLDGLRIGAALVDQSCRLIHSNGFAEERLHLGDSVRRVHGRLAATSTLDDRRLQELVTSAVSMTARRGGALRIRSLRDGATSLVAVVPFFERGRPAPQYALVLWLEDGSRQEVPTRVLMDGWGLTSAEAKLVTMLVKSFDLRMAAGRARISYETALTYLKRSLEKLGVSTQTELVALLSGLNQVRWGDGESETRGPG
jgi:DNA-binding CsgD family transcriptional regulator